MYHGIEYRLALPPVYLRFPKLKENLSRPRGADFHKNPALKHSFLSLAVAVDYGEITADTEVKGESKVKTILKNPRGNESLSVMLLKSVKLWNSAKRPCGEDSCI